MNDISAEKEGNEDQRMKKYEVLNPLLVLEILKNNPTLKFKVIKKYQQ